MNRPTRAFRRAVCGHALDQLLVARAAYGAALLVLPTALRHGRSHDRVDAGVRIVAGVIGVRNLVEAAVVGHRRTARWVAAAAAIDTTHAASMLALAIARPNRRVLAGASATMAAVFAAVGVAEAHALRPAPLDQKAR